MSQTGQSASRPAWAVREEGGALHLRWPLEASADRYRLLGPSRNGGRPPVLAEGTDLGDLVLPDEVENGDGGLFVALALSACFQSPVEYSPSSEFEQVEMIDRGAA